jgi:hypothetical protein
VDGEVWPSGGLGGGGVVDEGKRFPESSGRLEKKREKSKKKEGHYGHFTVLSTLHS